MKHSFGTFRHSLFTRLLFIFLAAGVMVAVIFSLMIGSVFNDHMHDMFLGTLSQYKAYILADIGTPPDTAVARQLAQRMNMEIALTGPGLEWHTSDARPDTGRRHFSRIAETGISLSHQRNGNMFRIDHGDYQLVLFNCLWEDPGIPWNRRALIIGALLLVLMFTWHAVRRLFRPLAWVREGAERIGRGDLDYRLPEGRKDELGRLSHYINSMAGEIKKMLEAKRQLLLSISHDLKTPLTRAKMSLEFVADEKVKASVGEDLDEINSLLDMLMESERLNTRHAVLSPEAVQINAFFSGITSGTAAKQGRRAAFRPLESDMTVRLDPLRFRLLLKNLLSNAFRHTPETGQVAVSLEVENTVLRLRVSDTGEGIPAMHMDKIADPFYRPDTSRSRKTGGYGLGLYLCRLIAQAHGGMMKLESAPGRGTVVTVEIPLDRVQA